MMLCKSLKCFIIVLFVSIASSSIARGEATPNIVFIITDDQEASVHRGYWAVKVLTAGTYQISLRRWPVEADQAIMAALPFGDSVPGASQAYRARPGKPIPAATSTLRIDDQGLETKPVAAGDKRITFKTKLTAGSHRLAPVFTDSDGHEVGPYYVEVTKP